MAAKFETKRREEANKIFTDVEESSDAYVACNQDASTRTLSQKYHKLEKLYKNEQSKWWEAVSLQKYLDVGRVPRGLRIFRSPTYENPNPQMLKEWTVNSGKCTTGMLDILVKYAWIDRATLLEEIDKLTADILGMDTQSNFD